MKIIMPLNCILAKFFSPLKCNALFFMMMYVLGLVCAWITLPPFKDATIYGNQYIEQFGVPFPGDSATESTQMGSLVALLCAL